jgi:hypothetical protein
LPDDSLTPDGVRRLRDEPARRRPRREGQKRRQATGNTAEERLQATGQKVRIRICTVDCHMLPVAFSRRLLPFLALRFSRGQGLAIAVNGAHPGFRRDALHDVAEGRLVEHLADDVDHVLTAS